MSPTNKEMVGDFHHHYFKNSISTLHIKRPTNLIVALDSQTVFSAPFDLDFSPTTTYKA